VKALRGVSLSIDPGQFAVLLGPSGSGKTTLLNIVGAIEAPTAGRVVAAGVDVTGLDENGRSAYRRDNVGFVFQFFNLVPTLTALENVALIAELTGPDASQRADEALRHVGLAGFGDRYPGELSGGQQQRVAIARAVVKEPPLLLADEPTGALDLETGRQVLGVLRALCREGHHTVLLVTHNSALARMADRVIRMHSGELAADIRNEHPLEAEDVEW
jgi:putative ABC transport system ATP-binding protein